MRELPFLRGLYDVAITNKAYIALAVIGIGLFLLFTAQVTALLVLAAFGVASSVVTMYKRFVRLPPALELISLTSVLVTLIYGPVVGIFYTVIVNLASEVFSGYPDVMTLTYIPSRVVQVLFAHFFSGMGVVSLGIWSVVVFNLVQQPVFMWLTDAEKRLKALYFVFLNIPINVLIFRFLAEPLLALLKAFA